MSVAMPDHWMSASPNKERCERRQKCRLSATNGSERPTYSMTVVGLGEKGRRRIEAKRLCFIQLINGKDRGLSINARFYMLRTVEHSAPVRRKRAAVQDLNPSDGSLEQLLAFERMLADLSARFANVPAERVETEIRAAQVMLQQFLGFDRSCFSEFTEDGSLVVVSSTAIDGVEPTPVGQLPHQLSWFFCKLRAGQMFVISNSGLDLPPEAAAETEFCRRTGLVSHLAIPLRIGGRVIGDIAFSSFREDRSWPEDPD
jgi:GAF domain